MRPGLIPDEAIWPGAVRKVIAGPNGDLTDTDIAPVEALVDQAPGFGTRFCVRLALEPGDLEKLQAGGSVWIAFYGAIVPFCVDVTDPMPEVG